MIAAVAPFLLGVAGVTRHFGIRLTFFVMGTVFFAASLVLVLTLAL